MDEIVSDIPLVLQLLVGLAGVVTADDGLHPGDDLAQAVITHLFKLTQDTSLEEDLLFFCFCFFHDGRKKEELALEDFKQ